MSDSPLKLLRSTDKPEKRSSHSHLSPIELRQFKAPAIIPSPPPASDYQPTSTQFHTAISTDNMTKTKRAYHDVNSGNRSYASFHALADENVAEKNADETGYCICRQAKLGEELMFKCEGYCGNWYHPKCLRMHAADIERNTRTSARWYCSECREQAYSLYLSCVSQPSRGRKK